jgi:ABC-type lipoprotein release transport system permease subunit
MRYIPSVWLWAVRDLIRRPFESILLAFSLSSVIIIASIALLLCQGISTTAEKLLEHGPSVVARRVVSGHWVPVPVEEAVKAAVSVPGVISATPRIWGVINGPEAPVTIIGYPLLNQNEELLKNHLELDKSPIRGNAIIGQGVLSAPSIADSNIGLVLLNGLRELKVQVIKVLPAKSSMAVHDIILLDENDARYILELEKGFASDLAIRVFHEQEADAILQDLVDAFPWPVSLVTKNETLKMYKASTARRAGLIYLILVPSLPGLALIVAVGFKGTRGKMYEAGLLKALGWTTKDIVGFFMCRAALIAFPASIFGMAAAYVLVYFPGISWPGQLFFGWQSNAPGLYLNTAGSIHILLQVAAGVLVPYLVSNLWPAIENATTDPHRLLQEEGG